MAMVVDSNFLVAADDTDDDDDRLPERCNIRTYPIKQDGVIKLN